MHKSNAGKELLVDLDYFYNSQGSLGLLVVDFSLPQLSTTGVCMCACVLHPWHSTVHMVYIFLQPEIIGLGDSNTTSIVGQIDTQPKLAFSGCSIKSADFYTPCIFIPLKAMQSGSSHQKKKWFFFLGYISAPLATTTRKVLVQNLFSYPFYFSSVCGAAVS